MSWRNVFVKCWPKPGVLNAVLFIKYLREIFGLQERTESMCLAGLLKIAKFDEADKDVLKIN
ncbi:hypothetical protein ACFGVR_08485 [Mucilaginibacter sp. AW1-3]